MPSMENRVTSLEEHRRDRDKHDDRMLVLMEKMQEDLHTVKIKMEKKISFIGGMAFTCTLLGSTLGGGIAIISKKMGLLS